MISVLVVDDSTFMRNTITSLLEQDSEIKVVGTARNGQEALEKAEELDPDVMTLDVDLPRLDGLGVLQQLMKKTPIPVLMVSSLTQSGAESTLKALEYGALDFIPKTMSCDRECFGAELQRKVRAIARRKTIIKLKYRRINQIQVPVPRPQPSQPADYVQTPCTGPRDLVVIGVSTGGPPVVQKILSALPADLPACILIAQHMPAAFTNPFAKRLDSVCKIGVTEAHDGDKFQPGQAYVCPGGKHLGNLLRGPLPEIFVAEEPRDALYKPSANVLFETAGKAMGRRTLGAILTGMGSDGCEGAKVLKEKGGCLIAQTEASCVVYGMPKAIVDNKLANLILAVDDIANAIITTVRG